MEHTRTINREFETGDKAVLLVESRSGSVSVEAHEGHSVRVEAIVHVWSDQPADADEAAALVEQAMEQDGLRVMLRSPSMPETAGWSLWGGKRGSRVDYNVRVPVHSGVRVLSRSGRVHVARTEGRVHIESQSGRVSVANVIGDVMTMSRSGSVAIEGVRGDVSAETRSGRAEVRDVTGCVMLKIRSGIADARDIRGDVKIEGHTGLIQLGQIGGCVQVATHTGLIRYQGNVLGDFNMKAHTGSIHLAVDPAHPFFIDAESQVGTVRCDLEPRRNGGAAPAGAAAGPTVRLRTHTGSIRISRL